MASSESRFDLGLLLPTVVLLAVGFNFWICPMCSRFLLIRGQLDWLTSFNHAWTLHSLTFPVVFLFLLRFVEGVLLDGVVLGLNYKSFRLLIESPFADDTQLSLKHKTGTLVTSLTSFWSTLVIWMDCQHHDNPPQHAIALTHSGNTLTAIGGIGA